MRKLSILLILSLLICFIFVFVGCGPNENPTNDGNSTLTDEPKNEEINEMYITINGNKMKVTLAKNSTVDALVELLKQGDVTYTANDYGGFEKVGNLGHTLPTNHVQTKTKAGDIVLYQTNQIVMFYGSNSWSYTMIGHLNYSSQSELETFLCAGKGSVQITLSLQ